MLLFPTTLFTPAIVAAAGLLLDKLSSPAVGAYGVRKLRTAYAGPCLRVRRAADNAEQDIGFDASGIVDTTAIKAFCSGSNMGYVSKWYDQGTQGQHLGNTIANNQPTIYSTSGGVVTGALQNAAGRPAIFFSGSYLQGAFNFGTSPLSSFFTASVATASSNIGDGARLLGFVGNGQDNDYASDNSTLFTYYKASNTISARYNAAAPMTQSTFQVDMLTSGGTNTVSVDGTSASGSTTANIASPGTLVVSIYNSTNNNNAGLWSGYMAEHLLFAGAPSAADRAAVRADQRAFYGTP